MSKKDLLTTAQAARLRHCSKRTLERERQAGNGPVFIKDRHQGSPARAVLAGRAVGVALSTKPHLYIESIAGDIDYAQPRRRERPN
jgi:hypothetical protein